MKISDSITEAINAYLDRGNTQYAIMIDGPWGIGKTYFILNSFIPMRTATKFVYTSLYGLKSFNEIELEIDAQITASDPKKYDAAGSENSTWPQIAKETDRADYVSNNSGQILNPTNYCETDQPLVICLDDLERWHGDLDVCLSYINRLVEHKNLKCILVGNLEEIPSKSIVAFSNAREKTIRHIYRYESDYKKIIDISLDLVVYGSQSSRRFIHSLIKKNFSSFERLLDEVSVKNIRIIAEALQLYEYIYCHNSTQFNLSRRLAFTYFMTLFSALILVTRYLVVKKDRDELLHGNHAGNKGFKFLANMGYFDDQETGIITPTTRLLLDTVFYRLDQISLKGMFSIVRNGYYIKADFEGDFDSWVNEQHYDSYLDKEHYYQLADQDAQQVFNVMLSSLIDSRSVTNPVTLLLLAERVISDIACGVVDYNPIEFKKQFIETVNSLYDSGQMQRKEINIFDIEGDRFSNSRVIHSHMLKRNNDYLLAAQKLRLDSFWRLILKSSSNIDKLLEDFDPQAVFSHTVQSEEVVEALESLDNRSLSQIVNWIETGFGNLAHKNMASIDPHTFRLVSEAIRTKYGNQIGIRANHFRQIAEIIGQSNEPKKYISNLDDVKASLEI